VLDGAPYGGLRLRSVIPVDRFAAEAIVHPNTNGVKRVVIDGRPSTTATMTSDIAAKSSNFLILPSSLMNDAAKKFDIGGVP
jgi:hypothetical protein